MGELAQALFWASMFLAAWGRRDAWYASYDLRLMESRNGVLMNITMSGAEYQLAVRRFFDHPGSPPPLSRTFQILALPQDWLIAMRDECPGMLATAYWMAAATSLRIAPEVSQELAAQAVGYSQLVPAVLAHGWSLDKAANMYKQVLEDLPPSPLRPQSVSFVVSHCKESLEWLASLPHTSAASLYICEKCGASSDLTTLRSFFRSVSAIELPNQAMESLGYASYLAQYRDEVSDVTIFLQGDPMHHLISEELPKLVLHSAAAGLFNVNFLHLNRMRFLSGGSLCIQEMFGFLQKLKLQQNSAQLPEFEGLPQESSGYAVVGSYCCSQFVVSKEAIQARSKHFYAVLASVLRGDGPHPKMCRQDPSHDSRPGIAISALMEHLWHIVFDEPAELPLREYDARLPLFLRVKERYLQELEADEDVDYHMAVLPQLAGEV